MELAKAYVQIIPSADGIKGKLSAALGGEASSAGDSAGRTAGNSLAATIKNVIAAAGIGAALKSAISEGADLQQSLGGIETLFKDSGNKVIQNAQNAYKTAGLSANAYMETVTSFSASLLQGLAGDTNKAADVADMAITDMSDNANKMGTSMELIQNAYQGFAKQNYTMLDNLKLGYGGTKTEMERLLADATKISGIEYNLDNLSDVYEAIHVIQEEMDITETTAKEAASTLSGSLASMKSAFSNVLGNLSLGEDIGPSLNALSETVFTFLTGNLIPMVGNVFSSLPEVLSGALSMAIQGLNIAANNADVIVQNGMDLMSELVVGIVSAVPYLAEAAVNIVSSFGSALINTDWVAVATDVLSSLRDNMNLAAGEIFGADETITDSLFASIINALPEISAEISNAFSFMQETCASAFQLLWDVCNTVWTDVGQPIWDMIMATIQKVSDNFGGETLSSTFQLLWDTCNAIWTDIGQPIWDSIAVAIQYISDNWGSISETLSSTFQILWDVCNTVWTTIGQPIWDMISFAIGSAADLFAEHMPAIMNFFQTAISGIQDTWNNHLKPVFEAIGDVLNNYVKPAFEFVWKTIIEPLITNVFNVIGQLWNNTLKPIFDGICDFLKGAFTNDWRTSLQGILNIVVGIFNGIRTAIEAPMNLVKDIVNSAIDFIKEKFNFSWELPHLKMPHFSISGSFSLNPPSVPSFGIEWYAKAMDNPLIMNRPTAFGINSLGQIMAGGEAGSEVISGTDTLMNMIASAVSSQNGVMVNSVNDGFAKLLALLIQYLPMLANMQIVLDSGETIGALAPGMDEALGEIATEKERGN